MGDFAGAIWHPSANFGERRSVDAPDMIVVHYTAMDTACDARDRLCDTSAEVSAHYVISEIGEIWQLVREQDRAWHAGAGRWGTVDDVNSHSVGIELANTGFHPFPEPQILVLEQLLQDVMMRWSIGPTRVIGHSDMAPARKYDPGPRFDWRRLAMQGLSIWPEGGDGLAELDLDTALRKIGYPIEDVGEESALAAFRLRFRPWAEGPADATDLAIATELAHRFPVDGGALCA